MSITGAASSQEVVQKVLALVRRNLSGDELPLIEKFVTRYYRSASEEDLLGGKIENLYGAAIVHWHLFRQRKLEQARLHVYNPHVEEHGWQSNHTVAEIIVDDMPFLVESIRLAINGCGLANHLVIHPVMQVERDATGQLVQLADGPADGVVRESIMHFEFDRQTDKESLHRVQTRIEAALRDVRIVVSDGAAMRTRLVEIISELENSPPPIDKGEFTEGVEFLRWLCDDNFVFLGFRDQDLIEESGRDVLRIVPESGLGILRSDVDETVSKTFASLSGTARERARKPELLLITRSNSESTVHRKGHMDYVGIKRMDASGRVVGERRFLGLYGSAAYTSSTLAVPLLRRKVRAVLMQAGFDPDSHDGRALLNILETYPRDELFQIPEDELLAFSLGILHLQERQQTRTFLRRDEYGRFYSCIVYIPRDQMSTDVRRTVADILEAHLRGHCVKFAVQVSESLLARVHFVIQLSPDAPTQHDLAKIEAQIVEATSSWREEFRTALLEQMGEERGTRLYNRYGYGFRAGYREVYSPQVAVNDADKMETLDGNRAIAMSLYRPLEATENLLRFKLFHPGSAVPLSDTLPMLENMGLKVVDEYPSKIKLPDGNKVWIHDFGIEHTESDLDLDCVKGIFQDAFAMIFCGEVSNDGFNRLVLRAGLAWREILILRAYCRYLRQVRATFSQEYIEQALAAHPKIARLLVELFQMRFDPIFAGDRATAGEALRNRITEALDNVQNLDEDRILRAFLGALLATLRTNYFQLDHQNRPKPHLSFKLNPERVPDMPQPRPAFEIFVYAARVEGVHLRGGTVARGGLRWSDRPEDFRTEVLGLVKAQIVKNAVIVPVGSKGGFVPRHLPAGGSRDEILAEGITCYRTFISGLLDLTDNIVAGAIAPPKDVIRHDADDPYLVVAADKGTATFSDIANEVAGDYGFWLGDAFASGGSAGYDHKGMGITAKGAWESVKRHFRELGVNTQTTPFTVVGIGDMAGDVFGNGMLLSRTIKLVGAFNHLHIFLDPDPDSDSEKSFRERERLFALPRSSWEDYDATLISKGGGIYRRSAKSIALTPEMAAVLGIEVTTLSPNEVIRALLQAPVDLLWNGGIGTYVKANSESHLEVGDRANDAVRVNGDDLRCRVVGEGGNLGLTQLGRIEFARNNGMVNTDAIDNAAGVDCSDHEVNIKILLNSVVTAGDMTAKQRNALLAEMTDEVSRLVLKNNYRQTLALSLAKDEAAAMIDVQGRLMREMEQMGTLDRAIEFLPTDDILHERKSANEGLTGPELAVILAYVKIGLYLEILASDVPDDDCLEQVLCDYFPTPLRQTMRERMSEHRLRREIIATEVANEIVNRTGTTFVYRLRDESAANAPEVVRAYLIASAIFDSVQVWAEVDELDNQVPAKLQHSMLFETRKLIGRTARWLLRNRPRPLAIEANIDHFRSGMRHMSSTIWNHLGPIQLGSVTQSAEQLKLQGVPESLARQIALFAPMASAPDILDVAQQTGMGVDVTAGVYFGLAEALDLYWLREQVASLPRETQWQIMARAALRDDMAELHRELAQDVLVPAANGNAAADLLSCWISQHQNAVDRCLREIAEFRSGVAPDFTMLSVAMGDLRAMRNAAVKVNASRASEVA